MHLKQKIARINCLRSIFDVDLQILTKKISEDQKNPNISLICHFSKSSNKRPRNLSIYCRLRGESLDVCLKSSKSGMLKYLDICNKNVVFVVRKRRWIVKNDIN